MKYPEKYWNFFKRIIQKDPVSQTEALELLVCHDFGNELVKLTTAIKLKHSHLPKVRDVYDRYPEFKNCNNSDYIKNINLYAHTISDEVEKFNQGKGSIYIVSSLAGGLEHYLQAYSDKK